MFDSIIKGLKMIFSSLKMAGQDPNLLVPSVLTVLTNIGFGLLLLVKARELAPATSSAYGSSAAWSLPYHAAHMSALNGSFDPNGFAFLSDYINQRSVLIFAGLIIAWWLTNRFLEGVTTLLVYAQTTAPIITTDDVRGMDLYIA